MFYTRISYFAAVVDCWIVCLQTNTFQMALMNNRGKGSTYVILSYDVINWRLDEQVLAQRTFATKIIKLQLKSSWQYMNWCRVLPSPETFIIRMLLIK